MKIYDEHIATKDICDRSTALTKVYCEKRTSNIPNAGNGLFATTFIKAGQNLGKYCGKILKRHSDQAKLITYAKSLRKKYLMTYREQVGKSGWVLADASDYDVMVKFINSPQYTGKTANVRWTCFGNSETIRDIEKGEELLVDYGNEYYIPPPSK